MTARSPDNTIIFYYKRTPCLSNVIIIIILSSPLCNRRTHFFAISLVPPCTVVTRLFFFFFYSSSTAFSSDGLSRDFYFARATIKYAAPSPRRTGPGEFSGARAPHYTVLNVVENCEIRNFGPLLADGKSL